MTLKILDKCYEIAMIIMFKTFSVKFWHKTKLFLPFLWTLGHCLDKAIHINSRTHWGIQAQREYIDVVGILTGKMSSITSQLFLTTPTPTDPNKSWLQFLLLNFKWPSFNKFKFQFTVVFFKPLSQSKWVRYLCFSILISEFL